MVEARRERLEFELQALSDSGYTYMVVRGAPDDPSELHVRIDYSVDGELCPLDVHFPVLYPFFRFEVVAPSLQLDHHQNPFRHNLCILGRGTRNWSKKWTLAEFLDSQIPLAIEAGREIEPSAVGDIEDLQAEPFSNYYLYEPISFVGIDGGWSIPPEVVGGSLVLGYPDDPPAAPSRVVVLEVQDSEGNSLVQADPRLCDRHPYRRVGCWARLDGPPRTEDAAVVAQLVYDVVGDKPSRRRQAAKGGSFRMAAALFPEEHAWRDNQAGEGWLATFEWRPTSEEKNRPGNRPRRETKSGFVRVQRVGQGDFSLRIPEASPLADKTVALIGVGCVGAPIAHLLAQSGVGRLCIVDPDELDPGTTVRWPLGRVYWGVRKVEALAHFLSTHFPYTTIVRASLAIGTVSRADETKELEILEQILGEADVVIDATAEHGVQRFLSSVTRAREIPYVWASGTWGGWGGMVGRVVRSDEACWGCIEESQSDGTITPPPHDPDGSIQPAGCGDVTFTGLAFDMQEVSLHVCRVVLGLLSESGDHYPQSRENFFTLGLRGEGGGVIPRWSGSLVARNSECHVCKVE